MTAERTQHGPNSAGRFAHHEMINPRAQRTRDASRTWDKFAHLSASLCDEIAQTGIHSVTGRLSLLGNQGISYLRSHDSAKVFG